MSKMADLYLDIAEMVEKGDHPVTIASELGVPINFVYDVMEILEGQSEELSPFETINS